MQGSQQMNSANNSQNVNMSQNNITQDISNKMGMNMNMQQFQPGQYPTSPMKKCAYYNTTPIEILNGLFSIFLKQKVDFLEKLGCCEKAHKYKIYACPEADVSHEPPKRKVQIFSCKEKSECCERVFIPKLRAFQIEIKCHIMTPGGIQQTKFLRLDKKYFCTYLCLNRPYMDVYYTGPGAANPNGDFLGCVYHNCTFCDMECEIYLGKHVEGHPTYYVHGSCCQLGVLFPFPCKNCSIVNFGLHMNDGQKIGNITKIFSGCMQEAFSFADNYTANFPQNLDWKSKALILAAIIFTDYRLFNKRDREKDDHH